MRVGLICGMADAQTAAIADAFAEGGFRVLASSNVGMSLARAGRIVEPIELVTREPGIFAGRVEVLHPRVVLALATRWSHPRERDAAQSRVAGAIDVLVCGLPQSPQDLDSATQEACRVALSTGPWIAQAALLDLAIDNHLEVLVLTPGDDNAKQIWSLRHEMCGPELRRELAGRAWRHLQGFRALQAWAQGWQGASDAAPRPATASSVRRSGEEPLPRTARMRGESGAFAAVPAGQAEAISGASTAAGGSSSVGPIETETSASTPIAAAHDAEAHDANAHAHHQAWPALPPAGRARVEVPAAFGARWNVSHAMHISAATRATLHAALSALSVVDGPAVVLAHGGAASVIVRILSTATRGILRALATDPRALDNGVLAIRGDLDLTSMRVLNDSNGVDRLAAIAIDNLDDAARSTLSTIPSRTIIGMSMVDTTATHALISEPDGVWLEPRRTPVGRAAIESVAKAIAPELLVQPGFVDAALLGVALLSTMQGSSAIAVNGEMALAICTGQAHPSDALQIVAAKARKQATKAVLVSDAGPLDAPLLQGLKSMGFAALCLVPRLDSGAVEATSGALPILQIPHR